MLARLLLNALSPAGNRGRLMIFPYHRILKSSDPMFPTVADAGQFERHIQWILRYCTPVSLTDGVTGLLNGTLPARAVALTFDDGYANNLDVAAPLLQKYGVPATIFIATDAIERGIMWNDMIVEAVRAADDTIDARCIGLGVLKVSETSRPEIVNTIIRSVQYLPLMERLEVCELIHRTVTGRSPERQMLRKDQLPELVSYGFELGAHTVNHPILEVLDDAQAWEEIDSSKRWLSAVTGQTPKLFAYPNGRPGRDYSSKHAEMVKQLGFFAAVSTEWGCATRRSSVFELPRFKPWEDTDFGFWSRLSKVLAQSYY